MSAGKPLTRPQGGHPLPRGERVSAQGEGEVASATPLNRARDLRHNMTDAEHGLWRILRNRQFVQTKFRRQVPIGPYIADFACFDARLIVEADGGQHCESRSDAARDAWFAAQGFRTLRFWNNDILCNPEGVAVAIGMALAENYPSPGRFAATLSRKGRG